MLLIDRREYNEYAPVPFWSWNNRLDRTEIEKQIRQMYEANYGGFVIHARAGLDTPYMGEEWLACVEKAISVADELGMKVWLYDEFGFPSGLAGGINLQDESKRAQYLEYEENSAFDKGAFAVFVEENGEYKRVTSDVGAKKYHLIFLKTSESEVDPCNSAVALNLIATTHERYYARFKEYFGDTVAGFFTDEPQYYRYATPYSKELEKEFLGDIRDGLIWLFKQNERGYAFRVEYYTLLNKLYTLNYYKILYDWCEAHHCKLTGHTVEEPHLFTQMWCCGGAMPSYEFCQVPGIDHLCKHMDGVIDSKQVASVAAQSGKKTVLTETFACSGLEADPRRLKFVADHQYVNGVNYMVQHLMNYSIQGQGITDNPPDFSPHTPWWGDIGLFNEYFAKLGYILRNTKESSNTLVIHPMQSAYLEYLRAEDENSIATLDEEFTKLTDYLAFNNVRFHYGDEFILSTKGRVEGNKFIVGKCEYDYVILPYMQSLSKSTYDLLSAFEKNGGKLCLYKDFPTYICGGYNSFSALKGNCSLQAIVENQKYKIRYLQGDKVLSRCCKGEIGEYVYIVNCDEKNCAELVFDEMEKFVEYDVVQDKTYALDATVRLSPCQAIVLKKGNAHKPYIPFLMEKEETGAFVFKGRTENTLTLDFVRFSKDGVYYSDDVFYSKMLDELIFDNYEGDLYVRYYFRAETNGDFMLLTGNTRIKHVKFDGGNIPLSQSDRDIMYQEGTIRNVSKGEHYIEFLIDYYQNSSVRHAVFDEGVTESLRNCLVYDTTIEPVFLKGNFSVFKEGVISANIPINGLNDLQKKGLKFFAGEVYVGGEIDLLSTNCKLRLEGDYMSARIYVNESLAGVAVLGEEVDISEFAQIGKNKVEITLTSSLRNMYGPHHVRGLDKKSGIIPRMFTFRGCWKGDEAVLFGQSYFAPDYEYAPFGLNKVTALTY